jgi:hypothetical protein
MISFNRLHLLLFAAGAAAIIAQPAAAQPIVPQGLDCGMAYVISSTILQDNTCNSAANGTAGPAHSVTAVPLQSIEHDCNATTEDCAGCACISTCHFILGRAGSFCATSFDTTPAHINQTAGAVGFTVITDNDNGIADPVVSPSQGIGFVHQEVSASTSAFTMTTNDALSQSFTLPQGAICGFHHTLYSPNQTCMGYNPRPSMPVAMGTIGPGASIRTLQTCR